MFYISLYIIFLFKINSKQKNIPYNPNLIGDNIPASLMFFNFWVLYLPYTTATLAHGVHHSVNLSKLQFMNKNIEKKILSFYKY